MYELYPDFNINIKAEQQDLLNADLVIIQHPFFWYAAPPLVKQWIDLVLEHNWAYGSMGDQLKGKKIMHIVSSGGTFDSYSRDGKNQYTYSELLRPFELTYKLCQMEQLPPFIISGANKISNDDLEERSKQLIEVLEHIMINETNYSQLEHVEYLNDIKL